MDDYLNDLLSLIIGDISSDIEIDNNNTNNLGAHQYLQDRDEVYTGAWSILSDMMTEDPDEFSKYVRMSLAQFIWLANIIKDDIDKQNTNIIKPICYQMRLAITLYFLATGDSYHNIKVAFNVGYSTIAIIIKETCKSICNKLKASKLKLISSKNNWEEVEEGFKKKWNLPNCIGAIDGKHIDVQIANEGSFYFNHKGRNSIVLMAVVDADRRFMYVDIGCNGHDIDCGIYSNTSLARYLEDSRNPLNIPPPKALPGRNMPIPHFFVVDDAFPLKTYMMKPFPFRGISIRKRSYNYRQSRARICVENAFGMLFSRFQMFKKSLPFTPAKVELFVLTTCILHNMLLDGISEDQINTMRPGDINSLGINTINASRSRAREIRDEIADYCIKEEDLNV